MSFIFQDGLYLVTQYPEVVKNYKKAILTPNVVEFSRLYEKVVSFDLFDLILYVPSTIFSVMSGQVFLG